MTKVCICQICTCGRHRCPHNPTAVVNKGNGICTLSEYATVYKPKPFEAVKSFKPNQEPQQNAGPMTKDTTNRLDYTKHPLQRPYVRQPDVYQQPDGKMDGVTSYKKDYDEKKMPQRLPIKPHSARKALGKFRGEPTYTGDFKAWPIDRVKPICNNLGYRPNSAPFQGNTGYQSDFQRHPLSVRQSMRPQEQTNKSDQPFNEETSYKKEYTLKCVTPPKRPPKAAFTASQAPFDSQTRYKIDFTEKQFPKVASCKPDGGAYVSNAPFQGQSTQKEDYIKKTIPERFIHTQDVYKKPDGEMEKNTTTHRDFDRKPMEPTPTARPAEKRGMPGKFRDETTNKVDYPWQAYQAQRVIKKSEYHPPEAPLEGVPTYQRDYTKHQINLVKSMKPLESAKISDEPFAQSTGYREEYTKKHMEPIARREQPVWNKNPAKFEGSTNYNQDYIEKTPEKRLNFKPDQTPYTTNDPFIASTTNRSDFTAMPLQKPYVHEGATYVPSTGQMEDQTTSKIDYCQKPIERSLPRRPPSSNRSPGKFYSDTTNKLDFGHKEPIFVQRVGPRQEYVKPDAPFAGLSNYTSDYQNKGYALRQSMRPNEAPISSGARFDDTTMYRTEFQKRLTKCPVMLLQSVTEASPTNYNFLGQDPTGHKFYEKTATPPIAV